MDENEKDQSLKSLKKRILNQGGSHDSNFFAACSEEEMKSKISMMKVLIEMISFLDVLVQDSDSNDQNVMQV